MYVVWLNGGEVGTYIPTYVCTGQNSPVLTAAEPKSDRREATDTCGHDTNLDPRLWLLVCHDRAPGRM